MSLYSRDSRDVVIAFYDAFNRCDLAAFDEILAPDWINNPADPGRENRREGFKLGVKDFHDAFEDFHLKRDAIVVQDNMVACRLTMQGRQVGQLGLWQPDGKLKTLFGLDMHQLRSGKIIETWHFERMA